MNNIKKLNFNDLKLLNIFISQEEEFTNFFKLGWNLKNIQNHFKKENNLSFGYFNKNILSGILIGENIPNNDNNFDFEIHIMFISSSFRRKNFGSSILNHIENNKNSTNISQIYIEVAENNLTAIKFYEKNNFVFFKIRHNYYNNKNNIVNARCYLKKI